MSKLIVKLKKLNENAVIPFYAKEGDAGMDLTAIDVEYNEEMDCYIYHTGIALEIPKGYVAKLYPRSSNRKTNGYLTNHVGIIDSGYRGEILACFKLRTSFKHITKIQIILSALNWLIKTFNTNPVPKLKSIIKSYKDVENSKEYITEMAPYKIGDKIAQLIIMPYPEIDFVEVKELSESERGEGGYGSTDSIKNKKEENKKYIVRNI